MLTFGIISIVVIALYFIFKQEQVINCSYQQIIEIHERAFRKYRFVLVVSCLTIGLGYYLYKCYPLHRTETYTYWLFGDCTGTREVMTATAAWSYVCIILGSVVGFISLIGFLDRLSAINKYKEMGEDGYRKLQIRKMEEKKKDEEQTKAFKRTKSIIDIISKL